MDINELFGLDPLKLTRDDRAKIIAKFRENRALFMAGQKAEKAAAKPKTKLTGLNLDDLDL